MSQQWYISRGGQSFGPFGAEKLQAMARAGELAPNDMVVVAGGAQWIAAASVPGLFPQQPAAPPITAPTRMQPPRAAPVRHVAPPVRAAVVAQAAAPPPPQIEVEAHSTFERYQYESFRSVRDDLSRLITIPSGVLMLLIALAVAALPCVWLYEKFLLLERVGHYSRVKWGQVGFSFVLWVVIPVLAFMVEFRIAKGLRRGERSAAYGLLIFILLHLAFGTVVMFIPPDDVPELVRIVDETHRYVVGGVLFGIVGLLQLPALIGAIREWDKFE